jgi:HEAT repeat protein
VSKKTLTNLIIVVLVVGLVWGVSAWQRSGRATSLLADLQKPDDYEAYKAMRKLDGLGPAALARAVPLLSASEPYVRARAAILVGETGDARYAPAVQKLLTDQDDAVREAAVTALGHLGAPESVQPLVGLLQDAGQPPEVRVAAARSLGLLASPEAAAALIGLLRAPATPTQAALREAATTALGTLRTKEAADELLSLVGPTEQDVVVRTLAAEALPHALAGAADEQVRVVDAALVGLVDDLGPDGKKLAPSEVRVAAAHALGQMALPTDIADHIRELLRQAAANDDEYWVRQAAREAQG